MNTIIYLLALLLQLTAVLARIPDNCNQVYWKPRMMGKILIEEDYMPTNFKKLKEEFAYLDDLDKPRRVLGPQTPVKDKNINSFRITVMVDQYHRVIGVECF